MAKSPKNKNINVTQKPKDFKKTFVKLLVNLKPYGWQIIISLIFAGISTVLSIIGPDQIEKIGKIIINKQSAYSYSRKLYGWIAFRTYHLSVRCFRCF